MSEHEWLTPLKQLNRFNTVMYDSISGFVIFFSGCMSWTLSMGQLMERNKKIFHYVFSLFLFSLGVFQFYNGMNVTGILVRHTWFSFVHLPFLAMIGPTVFFIFKSVLEADLHLGRRDILHTLPVLLIVLLLVPLFRLDPEIKKTIILIPPGFRSGNSLVSYYTGVIAITAFIILSYMIIYLKNTLSIVKIGFIQKKKVSNLFMSTIVLTFSMVFIYISGLIINNIINDNRVFYHIFLQYMSVVFFIVVLLIHIMAQGEMNYYQTLINHTEKIRYEQSKIRNLDIEQIQAQLVTLMMDEKVYCDEDISLTTLSRELGIESYQLSQIINEKFRKNFSTFINEYRINEAKKILIEDKGRTIISVSYAVGFNSPASFYDWFLKLTGSSPAKYRKSILLHQAPSQKMKEPVITRSK